MTIVERRPDTVDDVLNRARPVLAQLAATAAHHDLDRTLPLETVRALAATGIGALRLPTSHGGAGTTIRQLFAVVIEIAAADSNVAQALRAHYGIIESLLAAGRPDHWTRWFPPVAAGTVIGNAYSELGTTDLRKHRSTLRRDGSHWVLNGEKFYSTGTLYSQLVSTAARTDDDRSVSLIVPVDRAGVTLTDDWDGFGQRLSASGSTRFDNVVVHDEDIVEEDHGNGPPSHLIPFFQLFLAAVLAGIARNASTDAVQVVQGRTRTYGHAVDQTPRHDPLVQQVIGEIEGHAYAAEALVLAAAGTLDDAYATSRSGTPDPDAHAHASITVAKIHDIVARHALTASEAIFRAGSASTTARTLDLDRHWRNARTIASHNPLIYKPRVVGDYLLNNTPPPASGFF